MSLTGIKKIYRSLLDQDDRIAGEIVDSNECNDYVRLSHLLANRSKILTAIKEVESLHESDLRNHVSTKERVSNVLSNAANSIDVNVGSVLLNVTNSL